MLGSGGVGLCREHVNTVQPRLHFLHCNLCLTFPKCPTFTAVRVSAVVIWVMAPRGLASVLLSEGIGILRNVSNVQTAIL